MSYFDKVLYHGSQLVADMREENYTKADRSYDKAVYFILREKEVYGDQAMENLYDSLPELITTALIVYNDMTHEESETEL